MYRYESSWIIVTKQRGGTGKDDCELRRSLHALLPAPLFVHTATWWMKQGWAVPRFWRQQNNYHCWWEEGKGRLGDAAPVSPIKPSIVQLGWEGIEGSEIITCLPPPMQHFPPAQASGRTASRWQLCPMVAMLKALKDSSLCSLMVNTREQLSVQSQVRFGFIVRRKGTKVSPVIGSYMPGKEKIFSSLRQSCHKSKG